MNSYIDVELKPDKEMPVNRLMNAVYTKLHKALFDMHSSNIGVSFPGCKVMLGYVLRIHGSSDSLSELNRMDWLGGMAGYCRLGEILAVPDNAKHRRVSRVQSTMSQSKLARLLKRGSISEKEAKEYRVKMFSKGLDQPFVEMTSASNGRLHRRYIEFGDLLKKPVAGDFDYFGLSKSATIPWF